MRVEPATPEDLPAVRAAYDDARAIQRGQRSPLWAELTDDFLLAEMAEERLLRVMDGDALVGVFTAAYDDRVIWGERERGEHVYLHRIGRAAGYPGRGLLRAVLGWAWAKCEAMHRTGLRIDTWSSNEALVALYVRHGFQVVGERNIDREPRLPAHYQGIRLTLLEASRPGSASP